MRTLAIETATEACSVALFDGDSLLAHDHRVLGRGHAEMLVPMIAALPGKGNADRILVSLGPGSFTGARIGIAAARALGFAWSAEVLGYPTLALVAAQTQAKGAGEVTVCMTGGHGEYFVQDFGAHAEPLSEMASLTPAAAAARGSRSTIVGSKAAELAEMLDGAVEALTMLPDSASIMLLKPQHFSRDLRPLYGRGPDATPQVARAPA